MRFIVDENLPGSIAQMLLELGHDAIAVADTDHLSASDRRINDLAIDEGRIVITRDLDFPLRGRPDAPGLVILRVAKNGGREEILAMMRSFIASPAFAEAEGAITVVTSQRIRSRRISDV